MAKELPYFQFEPAAYLSGNIQLCSYEAQGVFINLKAIYWQRDCNLSLDQAQRRLKSDCFQELIDEDIIKIEDGNVIIAFLDNQYTLISKRKKRLSEAGSKGAQVKKDKALVKPPLSEVTATLKQPEEIREDKKREDKSIKKENKGVFNFRKSLLELGFKETLVDDWLKVRKNKKASNTETALNGFITQVDKTGADKNFVLQTCVEKDWKGFEASWLGKQKNSAGVPEVPDMDWYKKKDTSDHQRSEAKKMWRDNGYYAIKKQTSAGEIIKWIKKTI